MNILCVNLIRTYGLIVLTMAMTIILTILIRKHNSANVTKYRFLSVILLTSLVMLLMSHLRSVYFVRLPSNPTWQNYCGLVFIQGKRYNINLNPVHITSQISVQGAIVSHIRDFSVRSGITCIIPCADGDPTWTTQCGTRLKKNDQLDNYTAVFGENFFVFTSCLYRPEERERDQRVKVIPWSDTLLTDERYAQENYRPYAEKKNAMVWRGENNGALRKRVISRLKTKRWANVRFVPVIGRFVHSTSKLSKRDQADYKLILSIDGWSYPSSIIWALNSGSVVVLISEWKTLLQMDLVAWEHFVPVSTDLCDLDENIEKILSDNSLAERIVENGKKKFNEYTSTKFKSMMENEMTIITQ